MCAWPGEFGYDTWEESSAKSRSGVNVWGYTSLDAERGILYMPLGAPNNDRVGVDRPGNNLFSSSLVAVEANTGKFLWHFQLVHHDIRDYDTQSAPLIVDLKRGSDTVPPVIIVNKTGLVFTLNRVTGKRIFVSRDNLYKGEPELQSTDAEFDQIVRYLTAAFPPSK